MKKTKCKFLKISIVMFSVFVLNFNLAKAQYAPYNKAPVYDVFNNPYPKEENSQQKKPSLGIMFYFTLLSISLVVMPSFLPFNVFTNSSEAKESIKTTEKVSSVSKSKGYKYILFYRWRRGAPWVSDKKLCEAIYMIAGGECKGKWMKLNDEKDLSGWISKKGEEVLFLNKESCNAVLAEANLRKKVSPTRDEIDARLPSAGKCIDREI